MESGGRREASPPKALFYFLPPKELELEAPVIQVSWVEGGDGLSLTLESTSLAKDVYLRFEGPGGQAAPDAGGSQGDPEGPGIDPRSEAGDPSVFFHDNFFDLLPGRARRVLVRTDLPLEVVQRGLRIRTLAEIPREGLPSGETGG
jgi:hypothetical protein